MSYSLGLLMGILAAFTIKPRVAPRKGTYLLPKAFLNKAYTLQVLGLFLVVYGVFTVCGHSWLYAYRLTH